MPTELSRLPRDVLHIWKCKATQQRQIVSAHHTCLTMKGDNVMRFGGGNEIFIRVSAELNTLLFGCQMMLSRRKERFSGFHALRCYKTKTEECAGRTRSEPDGTRWRTGGEVKGKLANGVGSQYSHATTEHGVSSITKADVQTSAASSLLNRRPHRFKWTLNFKLSPCSYPSFILLTSTCLWRWNRVFRNVGI